MISAIYQYATTGNPVVLVGENCEPAIERGLCVLTNNGKNVNLADPFIVETGLLYLGEEISSGRMPSNANSASIYGVHSNCGVYYP